MIDRMHPSDHDRRAAVVDAAIAAYRSGDFHRVDVHEVAAQAGVDAAEVERLFPVWELLLVTVVDRWDGAVRRSLWPVAEQHGTVPFLRAVLERSLEEPALVRMRLAVLSAAGHPAHAAYGWFTTAYTHVYEDLTLALVRDVVAHREPTTMAPRHAAEQLLALFEGLQLQLLLRDDIDLLAAFDRAVARMRSGWSSAYAQPA